MPSLTLANLRSRLGRPNRIYIMPTGRGALFLGVIVIMVLTAATYNNNLIFMLAFFLFSLFVVSMIQTHYNLKGVRLHFLSTEDGFAGDRINLLFHLEQKRARFKNLLHVRSRSKRWPTLSEGCESLNARDVRKPIRVTVQAPERGIHALPDFVLETFYPVGLFRAWKVFRPEGEIVVYPHPAGLRQLSLANDAQGEEELGLRNSPEGDFGELKNYLPGESYHQIAWKHYARTGSLYSKVHWGEEHRHFHIPWDPREQTLENYLSQMSAWVKHAVDENATFTMELPRHQIASGSGPDHARICWRALAALKVAS